MFVYIRSAAFVIVVTKKLVLQQSKNVTAKCTETPSPSPYIHFSLKKKTKNKFNVGIPKLNQKIIYKDDTKSHYFKKSLNLYSVHLGFIMVAVTAPIIYLLKYS